MRQQTVNESVVSHVMPDRSKAVEIHQESDRAVWSWPANVEQNFRWILEHTSSEELWLLGRMFSIPNEIVDAARQANYVVTSSFTHLRQCLRPSLRTNWTWIQIKQSEINLWWSKVAAYKYVFK